MLEIGEITMTHLQIIRLALVFIFLGWGAARAQDSAVFDAQKNTWKLYYKDPETEQWVRKGYVQQNAIAPSIKTVVQATKDQYEYRYRISNRRDARQLIDTFRVWGIPLIYTIPDLPPVTANAQNNPELEDKQRWAQLKAKRSFENSVIKAPKGWSGGLRVDEKVRHTSFVWTPGLKDSDPDGIPPGTSQDGFTVTRAELPGVARAKLTGSTEEPWGLDNLPDTPFWRQKVDEIQDLDYLLVPVLAPVIPVPVPYNGAELARRLQAHVQTWLQYGHIHAELLARLNRQFDVLIPALEIGNKRAAHAAMAAMRKDCAERHPGFGDEQIDADDDAHDAGAMPRTATQRGAYPQPAIDRVATRALAFDLRYLTERLGRP
jgi:hypothetical protein